MLTKVYGGTGELGRRSLCDTCRHSRVTRGARMEEEIIMCNAGVTHSTRVLFKVLSCSEYIDTREPSYLEMLDKAWILRPATKRRAAGFIRSSDLEQEEVLQLRMEAREID